MYLQSNIDKLKKRKKELEWSNQKLSDESKVPVGTINKIFSGATKYPRQETMNALVKAMGLDYYDIEDYGAGISVIREAGINPAREDDRATLKNYYELPEDARAELIDGAIYYMAAPSLNHQTILIELGYEIRDFIKKKKRECRMFLAPVDVCLDNDDFTMVQPDIAVVCDREKYEKGDRCNGAPDFIVEIVSKSNPENDYFRKLQKYQNAGVKEYWIVDPIKMRVIVYCFAKDTIPMIYTFDDKVQSVLNPELEIDFLQIKEMLL